MKRFRGSPFWFGLVLILLFPVGVVAQIAWKPDFATAMNEAKKEGKDVLIFVTGTDWSKKSRDYRDKLLSSSPLSTAFGSKFLFVEIDKPDWPTEEQKKASENNKGFKSLPRVFPGVAVLDSEGLAWFSAGNLSGSPEELIKRIGSAQTIKAERDKLLQQAEQSAGLEKAKSLAAALELMERQDFSTFPISNHGHRGLLNEIKKLDPDDSIGVVRRLTFNTLEFAERQVEPLLRDKKYAQAHELIDREFADPRNDTPLKQHLLAMRFRVFQAEEKLDDAVATLRDIVKLDPKGKMGSLADGYIDFSIKPIVLKNGRYCGLDLRPFFGDMRIDVTGIVKEAGPYEAAIIPGGGGDIRIRDVSLYLGDPAKDKSRSKLVVKTEGMHTVRNKELVVPLAVPSIPPGSQLWLCVPTQGTGWFGSYGRIELRKK